MEKESIVKCSYCSRKIKPWTKRDDWKKRKFHYTCWEKHEFDLKMIELYGDHTKKSKS